MEKMRCVEEIMKMDAKERIEWKESMREMKNCGSGERK